MMNLLPIPVLDGGVILLSVAEMIKRAPLKPKVLYYVQFIGIAFIMLIFIVAVFGDIKYLLD
jgi:regulator of sigma E protease